MSGPPSPLVRETEIRSLGGRHDLLVRRNPANDIVAVEFVLPMGAREEPPEKAGISTLALRMLSRGTRFRTDYEIAVALESLGASFATDVRKDRAAIGLQTTSEKLGKTLDVVEEILTESSFPEDPFEVEKEILIQEIQEDLDSPYTAAFRLFQETLFREHPYGRHSAGTRETISALSHAEVRSLFQSRFGKGKICVGVVGNVDPDSVEGPLARILGAFEGGDLPPFQPHMGDSFSTDAPHEVYEVRSTEAECIVYGFRAPGLLDPEYPALKVLDSVLGGSMDSRLFAEIREKQGLVYQIGSTYPALEWQGMFAVSLVTTVGNHARVLDSLRSELDRLKQTPPSEDEILRARTYLQGTFLMAQEKNADQADILARYHSLGLGIDFVDRYPVLLEKVTPEEVRQAAAAYFDQPTLAIVGPGNEETGSRG